MRSIQVRDEGEMVWYAMPVSEHWSETCPECLGTKQAEVHLKNGQRFAVKCELCEDIGSITISQTKAVAVQGYCHLHEIRDGRVLYTTEHARILSSDRLHDTQADAQADVDAKNKEYQEQEEAQLLRNINHGREKYSWSLHYWRRQRTERVKEIERIDRRIKEIKEKS